MYFMFLFFVDLVYFQVGSKNPKLIVDDQDFLCIDRRIDKTIWRCCQYYYSSAFRCKVKLVTSGRVVEVVGEHNHPAKLSKKIDKNNMLSQKVTVVRSKYSQPKKY